MTSPKYRVTDPSTGEVIESFGFASDEQIDALLASSSGGYDEWKRATIADRAAVARQVGKLFADRSEELAAIATREMGKSAAEGIEETQFCAAIFDYFATEGPGLTADQVIKTMSGGTAFVQRLPVGPVLGIMPWNFPYYQVARFAAPNLVLGNTVIVKHAESVPRSALAIQRLMTDAGVPEGVYLNVFASHSHIERIIADARVQGVSLTGSERAGSIVASLAGKNLKKCVLELGGSDPMIILDSDDLDDVVNKAWDFRMYNTGQACNSNKRMIVIADLYGSFVQKLTERAHAASHYSPMSSRAAAETLAAQVSDAVSKGAALRAGGVLCDGPAAFYSPAVLTGVTKEMRAYREELFGPVAVVYRVESDQEALELANDTDYGLGGSVFSADPARAKKIAAQLESGMANVNSTAGEGAELPFGGVKRSGFGRELGPLGMDEFVNKRMFFIA